MIRRYKKSSLNGGEPLRFLEVGSGPGNFVCCLESWFKNSAITALEIDFGLLSYAANRSKKAKFLQGNAENLPFLGKTFHILSVIQVIEHFPNPEKFLNEAHRVLKDDGLILLATPNPRGLGARLLNKRWSGIRYDHISLRTPEQWHEALEKNNYELLNEGTTLFNGLPLIGRFPLGLPFQLLQAFVGWFPWQLGESYMVLATKKNA
jgi:ubiquinone/menaquinone biosynthesis C-methylase UbiE